MLKRRLMKSSGLLVAAALLTWGAKDASAQERRIATLAPPGSSWMKVLNKGAAAIRKATDGRVKIKFFPGGSQGDERDVVRKMRLGGVDGAALTSVGLAMIYPGIRVLELPRLFDSVKEMDYVRRKMWPYFKKRFEQKGFILGEPGDVGFIYFMSKSPVKSVSDLRQQKVWMWTDDQLVKEMFKELNVNGVPLGVPDVQANLTSGRINACYGSPLAAVALQWAGKIKYMTSMPMSYAIGATVITKKSWDTASAEDQKIQQTVTKNLGRTMRSTVRRDNNDALSQMKRKGVKVVTTPPALIRDFDNAAKKVWSKLAGNVYSQKELDLVLKLRDKYRADNP